MLTPRLNIGSLNLINIPTMAIGLAKPTLYDSFPKNISYPILGRQAFYSFVTTMDYPRKKLILRNKNYNVKQETHSEDAHLIPFTEYYPGIIVLSGTWAGHSATFQIDTGSSETYVTSTFAKKYLSFVPSKTDTNRFLVSSVHNISGRVGGLSFRTKNVYIMQSAIGPDVLLGTPFSSQYRITIDHFRKVLLIE
jgi:hypothetical protein